ncbi:hypothetical protein B0J13DRAFT_138259 [Dactylonectria estremocensis]|uniref:BZIP domain-containing protein n=1 Tax=Dactylonectria estremocensis TaxID=1079267 RepID=A0A9P9E1Q1_9HYPO|nr:hypothetical protein B0J13DRAFT_138259 [Dactylonectria estremocensis]
MSDSTAASLIIVIEQIMAQRNESADFSATEGLASLLSAESYLLPDAFTQQLTYTGDERSLSDDVYENTPVFGFSEEQTVSATAPDSPTVHRLAHQDQQAPDTAGPAKRKRGRPRKSDGGPSSQRPEDRRREQIRRAQKAFRSRQEANLANNEARIRELEAAIGDMSSLVTSFGQDLAQSGLLMQHSSLESRLCNVLEISQNIAEKSVPAINEDRPATATDQAPAPLLPTGQAIRRHSREIAPYSLNPAHTARFPTTPPLRINFDLSGFLMPLSFGSPLLFDTPEISAVEIPFFIRQLSRACTYHAYFSLRNPSLQVNDLRGKFRFLLSMLSRESLVSYFGTAVQVDVHPNQMEEWNGVPFLSVGGAGTHYLEQSSSSSSSSSNTTPGTARTSTSTTNQTQVRSPGGEHPVFEVPFQTQGGTSLRWFDIRDLEAFLQEKQVHLLTTSDAGAQHRPSGRTAINASKLIRSLVVTCICLGRSPGWRPVDVEQALRNAAWENGEQ